VSYSEYEEGRLSVCIRVQEVVQKELGSEVCPNMHGKGSGLKGVQGEPECAWKGFRSKRCPR
jgi:hypothetical protein